MKFNTGIVPRIATLKVGDKVLEHEYVPVYVQFYFDDIEVGGRMNTHWPDDVALHQVVEKLYLIVKSHRPTINRAVAEVEFEGSLFPYLIQDDKAVDDPREIPED